MGGTGNIVKGLETLMIEENIKVIKGVEVKRIIEENKNIKGVELNNGEKILADNVVCNADPPGVYEKLLNKKKEIYFSIGKEIEWIIQWVCLFIILEQKKFITM